MGKTFSGIKSVKRNFKGGGRAQNRQINEFLAAAVGCALGATKRSINLIARRGLQILVDSNNYADYTGVLRNSYQAALIENGNVEKTLMQITGVTKSGGSVIALPESNKDSNAKNTFGNRGKIIILTSEGMDGTVGISIPKTPMIDKRENGRSPKSPPKIHNRWAKMSKAQDALRKSRQMGVGRKLQARQHGYGRVITQLKGMKNLNPMGYTIVFSNPTPYTEFLNSLSGKSKSGKINKKGQVIPLGLANAQLKPLAITITKQEIADSIKRAKDALRKRNTQ